MNRTNVVCGAFFKMFVQTFLICWTTFILYLPTGIISKLVYNNNYCCYYYKNNNNLLGVKGFIWKNVLYVNVFKENSII